MLCDVKQPKQARGSRLQPSRQAANQPVPLNESSIRAALVTFSGNILPRNARDRITDSSGPFNRQEGTVSVQVLPSSLTSTPLNAPYDPHLEDIGFMTCMTLTLLGNYSQTGHFGGPLAYTPYNVAIHLAGPEAGGLRYDYRRPKHPYADKFMLAAGHCAPTSYALWMIMGEALYKKFQATGDRRYYVAPKDGFLPSTRSASVAAPPR